MNKKSRYIVIASGVVIGIILTIVIINVVRTIQNNKYDEAIELGEKYVLEDNYAEALIAFNNAIEISGKRLEAQNYINIVSEFLEISKVFNNEEYSRTIELINEFEGKEYDQILSIEIESLKSKSENKVKLFNEIDNLEVKIDEFIISSDFDDATLTISEYMSEDINDEYKNKLNIIQDKVNNARWAYEEEVNRLAEEERNRKEEEIKSESSQENLNIDPYYRLCDYWFCSSCNMNTTVPGEMYIDQNTLCAYCGGTAGYHLKKDTRANVENR